MADSPYEIRVYDKGYQFRGWAGGPSSLEVRPRHNLPGSATIELDSDHARAADLIAPGGRVEIYHHGEKRLTGVVGDWSIPDLISGALSIPIIGDYRIIQNTLGFPVPSHTMTGATINGQTVEYRTITGSAEYVIKTILAENLARIGRTDVTIAPNLDRGTSGTYTFRMHQLYDRLMPAIEQAGLGVSVLRDGENGLVVDVYEPRLYPHILSVEGGTITAGSATFSRPTATRVVVGGQGEGTARTFKQYVDTAREAEWGDIVEVFQDARDSESGDVYQERAAETLAEGAPKTGLSLSLSETAHFRYGGDGVHVGDKVRVNVRGLEVTEVLREAVLSWTPDAGDVATPVLGERKDDPSTMIATSLRRLAADNRDRKAR